MEKNITSYVTCQGYEGYVFDNHMHLGMEVKNNPIELHKSVKSCDEKQFNSPNGTKHMKSYAHSYS